MKKYEYKTNIMDAKGLSRILNNVFIFMCCLIANSVCTEFTYKHILE